MIQFSNYFEAGPNNTLRNKNGVNWAYKGQWVQVFDNTEIDRWYVGDYSSASYQITIELGSNKKEILSALVVARPDQASVVIYGRVSIDDTLISLTATVNNSYLSLKASPSNNSFAGAKLIYHVIYAETINELTNPSPLTYLPGNDPSIDIIGGGSENEEQQAVNLNLNDLLDVTITAPSSGQLLGFNGTNWINVSGNFVTPNQLTTYAPLNSPTFTGTVNGITAAMIGLGNVTNESKVTMFNNPTFTGTVSGITKEDIGLGNVDNESKAVMFTNPIFTGTAIFDTINLGSGATVTEFSTDPTLIDSASNAVPTEGAVKAYVDTALTTKVSANNPSLTGTVTIGTIASNSTVNINGILNAYSVRSFTKTGDNSVTGTYVMDCSKYDAWAFTITGATTLTFTNVPNAGLRFMAFLFITQGGSGSISAFPSGTTWPSGLTPTFTTTTNRTDIFALTTYNGGVSWFGTVIGQNYV